MISRKPGMLILLFVVLLLLTACDDGGGDGIGDGIRDSCEHLSCTPETDAMEKIKATLEDAEDGIIDKGESELGDAVIRAAEWLSGTGE